jgi:16S rRNA (guanine1516-N2)-methyltransferase
VSGPNAQGADAHKSVTLVDTEQGKALSAELASGRATLVVDFTSGAWARRVKSPKAAHIVAACGKPPATVLDCTAGFLRDALALAASGFVIDAIEREPVLHAAVFDALVRARAVPWLAPVVARITHEHADADDVLDAIARGERPRPDVVVIDPMFDEDSHGSASVKKDMQMARLLSPPAPDEGRALLEKALVVAKKRVVVKRPRGSAPLVDGVSFSKETRAARLDVYVVTA